jgi:glycosyltransferase involved in cell wall biosynthesis
MKVAIITDLPGLYEDTMYLNELEKKLPKIGIICKVFVIRGSKIFEKIDTTTGFFRFLNISKLLKNLSDFDIIHVQFTFPLGFGCTLLASLRLLNKPIIIHTHGYDVFTVPSVNYGLRRNQLGKKFTNYTWRRANKIITVCEKAKFEIEKTGINDDKINVLYNGIDENLFRKNRIDSNYSKELSMLRENSDILFLSVASIVPVKNHVRILKTFEKLVDRYHSKYKIKLALIGEHNNDSLLNDAHSNVVYLGKKKHSELSNFYNIADVFILPSLSEAHPWSMLEAMSCELPIIASNVGGIPETIDDSRFLVNPLDEQDILKKFEQITEMNSSEREKIGFENRKKILNNFTIMKHIHELKNIYNNLLSQ